MINNITLYGESHVNWFWAVNGKFTDMELNEMKKVCYEPVWDDRTTLLANFNNNLNAGNVAFVPSDLKHWAVYKRAGDSSILQLAAIVPANMNVFTDFNVKNNTTYTYYLYPETDSNIGTPIVSEPVTTNFRSWSLSVLEETDKKNQYLVSETFIMDLDVRTDAMNNNSDSAIYQNFTKYPKIQKPRSNYMSGTISFVQGKISKTGEYIDSVELMKKFQELSTDGKKKILKDRKGNGWLVDITSSVSYALENNSKEQPIRITLNWTEIGSLDDLAIYSTERDFIWILEDTQSVMPSLWTDNMYDKWNAPAVWHP